MTTVLIGLFVLAIANRRIRPKMISTVLLGAAILIAALTFLLVAFWRWQRVRQHITDTTSTTHHND